MLENSPTSIVKHNRTPHPPCYKVVPTTNGYHALWSKCAVITGPGSPNDGTLAPGAHRALPWLTVKYPLQVMLATALDICSSGLLPVLLSS